MRAVRAGEMRAVRVRRSPSGTALSKGEPGEEKAKARDQPWVQGTVSTDACPVNLRYSTALHTLYNHSVRVRLLPSPIHLVRS